MFLKDKYTHKVNISLFDLSNRKCENYCMIHKPDNKVTCCPFTHNINNMPHKQNDVLWQGHVETQIQQPAVYCNRDNLLQVKIFFHKHPNFIKHVTWFVIISFIMIMKWSVKCFYMRQLLPLTFWDVLQFLISEHSCMHESTKLLFRWLQYFESYPNFQYGSVKFLLPFTMMISLIEMFCHH